MKILRLLALVPLLSFQGFAQISLTFNSLGSAFEPGVQLVPSAVQVSSSPSNAAVTVAVNSGFTWFSPDGVTCDQGDQATHQSVNVQTPAAISVCVVAQFDLGAYVAVVTASAPGFAVVSAVSIFDQFPPSHLNASILTADVSNGQAQASIINNFSSGYPDISISRYINYPPAQPANWLALTESTSMCSEAQSAGASCNITLSANPNGAGLVPGTYVAQVSYIALGNRAAIGVTYTVAGAPLRFIPVTPCRVVDTRFPNGVFGTPILAGKVARSFPIPQSACNIPSTAQAYSLNVTVVPSTLIGLLSIWPTGQPQPTASTLNSDGRVKADAAIVPAGTGGAVSVYSSDDTQLVLDINGYFVPASDATALAYYPLTPCRVVDTRFSTGPLSGPMLTGKAPRDFPILLSGCGIPAAAQAYSLNFTAVPPGVIGYLTAWPSGQPQPVASILNTPPQSVTANAAILPAGNMGDITVYSSDDTHLVLDVNGYFAPPGAVSGATGLSLNTLSPCRVADTRFSGSGNPVQGLDVFPFATSPCNIPLSAQAYVVNATVVPSGPLGFLSLWPTGEVEPNASTLNADGSVTSNMSIVPSQVSTGTITAFASNPTHVILDISSYFAP